MFRHQTITRVIDRLFGIEPVYAHCDVPCGIYDPHTAALSAKTVHTMNQKVSALPVPAPTAPAKEQLEYRNTVIRMVQTKEQHAQLCKQELLILWTDYFKPEHLAKWPDLHEKVWKITKQCSTVKRSVSKEEAQRLKDMVKELADIFNETKK